MKLFESEQKVMEVLWRKGEMSAKEISKYLSEEIGWNKNTTYTVIKKCITKGAIERKEPGFLCKPLIQRDDFESYEIKEVLEKAFKGSKLGFFSSFLENENLSKKDLEEIEALIREKKEKNAD